MTKPISTSRGSTCRPDADAQSLALISTASAKGSTNSRLWASSSTSAARISSPYTSAARRGAIEARLGRADLVEASHSGFDPLYWAFRRIQGRQAWETDGAMIARHNPPLGLGVAEHFAYGRDVLAPSEVTSAFLVFPKGGVE